MTGVGPAAGSRTRGAAALAALVFLVALNLRPPITSVGPLLPQIGADLDIDKGLQGLLGALPLIAFGAVSPFVHHVSRRLGADRTMLLALVVLAAGTVVRSYTGVAGLWIGTVVVGSAIAVGNVLMPPLVKRDYGAHISGATGVYTACINIAAGVASSLAVPLSRAAGWQGGLGFWAIPALIVALLWIARLRAPSAAVASAPGAAPPHAPASSAPASSAPPPRAAGSGGGPEAEAALPSVWRQPTAWLLTGFMALQSTTFYFIVTWLPTIEGVAGVAPERSGVHLLLFQAIGVLTGLTFPRLMRRADSQVSAAIIASSPILVGVLGLMFAPTLGALWALITGLGVSASFVVVLSLISLRGRTTHETTRLSGMVQSIGYLAAAAGPVLAGLLAQRTGGWTASLILLAVVVILQIVVAGLAGRVPADRR